MKRVRNHSPSLYRQPPVIGAKQPTSELDSEISHCHEQIANTSGMGNNYPAPPEAKGWTYAGFVPYGLFAYKHSTIFICLLGLLGVIPLLGIVTTMVYIIYVGLNGREMAWRNRRFESVKQFDDTMRAWNRAGFIIFLVSVVLILMVLSLFLFD